MCPDFRDTPCRLLDRHHSQGKRWYHSCHSVISIIMIKIHLQEAITKILGKYSVHSVTPGSTGLLSPCFIFWQRYLLSILKLLSWRCNGTSLSLFIIPPNQTFNARMSRPRKRITLISFLFKKNLWITLLRLLFP